MDDMPGGYASEDNVRHSIPSMSEYSFHTPRANPSSRRTSGRATPTTPTGPNTPPRFPDDFQDKTPQGRDSTSSAMDPKNFTPNLHASLVSEILALRRELESKSLSVETLESNLQAARSENDSLQENVAKNARESRAVKKQLESIETGTLSAIESLCKERDEANDAKAELKRRLDESQTKVKTLDSETKRLNNALANDRRHWENERASLVRRMTVAENRLKAVVKEFAGAQAVPIAHAQEISARHSIDSAARDHVRSDESDDQAMSSSPQKNGNSNGHGHGRGKSSITTIDTTKRSDAAPKGLSLAEEINFDDEYEAASDEGPFDGELHRRHLSSSTVSSDKAQKVLGMVSQIETRNSHLHPGLESSSSAERAHDPYKRQSILEPAFEPEQELPSSAATKPQSEEHVPLVVDTRAATDLSASAAVQIPSPGAVSVVSASTQTETEIPPRPSRDPPALPTSSVPSINILDPEGGAESKSLALPAQSSNVACQTDFTSWSVPSRSASTQTEASRLENTTSKLATTLLPTSSEKALSTSPVSSHQSASALQSFADTPSTSYEDVKTAPDGKDDVDSLEDGSWARLKRALRPSGPSRPSTDAQDSAATNVNNDALVIPPIPRASNRPARTGRPSFDPPTPVPEDEKVGPTSTAASQQLRQTNFATLVQQIGHSNSPSIGSAASSSNISKGSGPRPPFAVPPRRSSRSRPRRSWKKGANGSPTRTGRMSPQSRIQFGQDPVLRKVQSAVALAPDERNDRPDQPPVPIHSAAYRHYQNKHSRSQPFLQSYNLSSPTSSTLATTSLQYSVVDAITATMIGEWMWKYVRKRKSFGVSEPGEPTRIADVRHRRWVWLSPYEKTIMWSSRQPTSNSALMGKPGRKLSIQSVLDVKDDTPMPKGAGQEAAFGRSILVLTPARALKFTAPTKERHYLWLNALSFLAHHSASSDDPDLHPKPDAATEIPSIEVPSLQESKATSSSTISFRGPLSSMRTSMGRRSPRSSGQATPMFSPRDSALHQRQDSDTLDSAFAPTVPRVPMHSRKRSSTNPSRARPALGNFSLSSPPGAGFASNVSMLSAASSSARGNSHSATSSFRMDHPRVEFDGPASWGHIPDIGEEGEPRASQASAEFGGSTNFFDEASFVRMSAFVSPGVVGASSGAHKSKQQAQPLAPLGRIAHRRGEESKDSFIGPPNIGRFRAGRGRSFFGRTTTPAADDSRPGRGFLSADEV